MTSKRNIKRQVEELSKPGDSDPPIVLNLTGEPETEFEESLATRSFPGGSDRETVAVPTRLPPRFWTESGFLIVVSRSDWDKYLFEEPDGQKAMLATEIWENLSDDELATEATHRRENGDPLPPLLEEYVTAV